MNEKNTPRDFFLHAGAFLTLYLGAIALITLLFSVINYVFPDPLQGVYYSDPYSGPIRFAIASLFVLVPLTVYLFFVVQKESRLSPERRTMTIRKWLTYITIFVAAGTVVGDLIALLYSFLGGTLPTAFFLKILVILAIMGAGFGYFLMDIKGYWVTRAAQSRMVGLGILVVVFSSIVGGMVLMGSPMTQRDLNLDNQQINDLMTTESTINNYWQATKGRLPDSLAQLENDNTGYRVIQSPEGREPYEYKKTSTTTYELCATFALALDEKTYPTNGYAYPQRQKWMHAPGRVCFQMKVDPALLTIGSEVPLGVPIKGF